MLLCMRLLRYNFNSPFRCSVLSLVNNEVFDMSANFFNVFIGTSS